jgi:hypothetical protein
MPTIPARRVFDEDVAGVVMKNSFRNWVDLIIVNSLLATAAWIAAT